MSVVYQPNNLLLVFAHISSGCEYALGSYHLALRLAAKCSLIGSGI